MSHFHDIEGREFDVSVYDKEYFEGKGKKSGYTSYGNARNLVRDQFQIIHDVMFPTVSADGEAMIHIDAGCAYGFGVQRMKELGWTSVGGDVSEFAIEEGKRLLGEDIEISVSDARKPGFWKGFDKAQACDLVTAVEFFEHIPTSDVPTVIEYMSKSARWGTFCINARTAPGQDEHGNEGDHGHLNNHSIGWWIEQFSKVGEIDFEAMYTLSKRSEIYNPDLHWHNRWVVVKFKEVVIE